jgi:2-oxoglutarate dehydrogenase E2 component (dihydrolipoamide succinyltransferase)
MAVEIKVPSPGESITEVEIGTWLKSEGDFVNVDEPIVEVETDKANLEIPAPQAGTLVKLLVGEGDVCQVGDVIAHLEPGEARAGAAPAAAKPAATPEPAPKAEAPAPKGDTRVMPAARRAAADAGVNLADVKPTGPGGRVLKEDVQRHAALSAQAAPAVQVTQVSEPALGNRHEEVVRMTRMRRTIAGRLVGAQQQAALLTTFNEIDMGAVMTLRKQYKETFLKRYNIKLGFMSFFVKAVVEALKAIPAINAEIRGEDIVYKNYYDIGVAVGGGRGLVVPIIRNAEALSFAEVEQTITDFGRRAKDGKIGLEELQGGTFTLSNGGIYGSLLSTPIVNPPQSGILGMHAIQDRPMAVDGQVVIRPMMYVALTYDHRLVDGREAVTFLKRVKECIEDPTRILLEV